MEETGFVRMFVEIANVNVTSAENAISDYFSSSTVVSILCRKGCYVSFRFDAKED